MASGASDTQVHIWIDADGCPRPTKEIVFRAAGRPGVKVTLVANRHMHVPLSPDIDFLQVDRGVDVADDRIVAQLSPGDVVVTSDIPLAAEVIDRGAHALSPRGELHTTESIGARLNMRDFLESLRAGGVDTGGPPAFDQRDTQAFANQLDVLITRARADH